MIKCSRSYDIDMLKWNSGHADAVSFVHVGGSNSVGLGATQLLNEQGYSCCIGLCAIQDGIAPEQLLGQWNPEVAGMDWQLFCPDGTNSELTDRAMIINDAASTTIQDRIDQLTRLFARYDVQLNFFNVDRYFELHPR